MNKLIINLCHTGMITNKQMTPFVPQSPEEIIFDVLNCANAGVSMVHIHACDEENKPTYRKDVYERIIAGIKEKRPDLVLIVSTSGRFFNVFEKRSEVLDLQGMVKPDMASLTLGSLNFSKSASINEPDMIIKLAEKMKEKKIKPELEVFDTGMVNFAKYLIKKELIEPPYYFNIILGNIATAQAKIQYLSLILSELPENSIWSLGGIGISQKNMNFLGILFGNGIRIGLEDNIWFDDNKTKLATNLELVNRAVKIAKTAARPIAIPNDARKLLQLHQYDFSFN